MPPAQSQRRKRVRNYDAVSLGQGAILAPAITLLPFLNTGGQFTYFHLSSNLTAESFLTIVTPSPPGWANSQIHDRIKSNNGKVISKNYSVSNDIMLSTETKKVTKRTYDPQAMVPQSKRQKMPLKIDKNSILTAYGKSCRIKGFDNQETSTSVKGELQSTPNYPPYHHLVIDCKMKPSLDHQYEVSIVSLDNIIVFILKNYEKYFLEAEDLHNLSKVNRVYGNMVNDVLCLRSHDFSELKKPRFDYAAQLSISPMQVDLAMACFIHYGLHPGMLIHYLNGEYTGKSRDAEPILREVTPHISNKDAAHIKRILTQGCPSNLIFEETPENKLAVIQKGNQHTFLQHPEVMAKAMIKKEKNSHVLPLRYWMVYFSPWL